MQHLWCFLKNHMILDHVMQVRKFLDRCGHHHWDWAESVHSCLDLAITAQRRVVDVWVLCNHVDVRLEFVAFLRFRFRCCPCRVSGLTLGLNSHAGCESLGVMLDRIGRLDHV